MQKPTWGMEQNAAAFPWVGSFSLSFSLLDIDINLIPVLKPQKKTMRKWLQITTFQKATPIWDQKWAYEVGPCQIKGPISGWHVQKPTPPVGFRVWDYFVLAWILVCKQCSNKALLQAMRTIIKHYTCVIRFFCVRHIVANGDRSNFQNGLRSCPSDYGSKI